MNFSSIKKYIILFVSLFFLILCYEWSTKTEPEIHNKLEPRQSVDTLIPVGMTLIPIEIQNVAALSELIGDYGVVDLFANSLDERKAPKKVASQVRVMRAPLNPDVYAVLVRNEDAHYITSETGTFFVTVQNPKANNFKISQSKSKKKKLNIYSEL